MPLAFLACVEFSNAQADFGRDLLRTFEIAPRNFLQRNTVEFDQSLVALHVLTLIDGHGQMPMT